MKTLAGVIMAAAIATILAALLLAARQAWPS